MYGVTRIRTTSGIKKKQETDGWFWNVLHILGKENRLFMVNKITKIYCKGYHIFLLQVVCHEQKPQIDGLFYVVGSDFPI